MKKIIAVALAAVLLITATVFGTVTYLTDVESDVNVMTMGDVEIAQIEMQRAKDEDGNWIPLAEEDSFGYIPDTLEEFVQNQRLLPAFYDNADKTMIWDDRAIGANVTVAPYHMQSWEQVGAPGANQLFDDTVRNVLDKFVFVENTGDENAYYRTVIAIECPEGVDPSLIHINVNGNARFAWETVGMTEIDGVQYILKVATYNEVLTPGEVSRPSLLQVYLDPKTTSADVTAFDGAMEIFVVSQAVQTEGFTKVGAAVALDEAFGDITIGQHPWTEESTHYFAVPAIVNNELVLEKNGIYYLQDEVFYQSKTATESVVIKGNGATVNMIASDAGDIGYSSTTDNIFSVAKGSGATVTIEDVTFTGNMTSCLGHYAGSSSNWYVTNLKNVHFTDNEIVSYSSGPGLKVGADGETIGITGTGAAVYVYGSATFDNCSITGTTRSALETDQDVNWPIYDLAVVNNTNTTINGGEYGSILTWFQLYFEINNAKIDRIDSYVNKKSGNANELLIGEGTTVGTLTINAYLKDSTSLDSTLTVKAGATVENLVLEGTFDADDRANIVIEDGATIGSYTVNGTEMTEAEFDTWLVELVEAQQ